MTAAVGAERPIRVLAVHHGGGVGGAPVSLIRVLAALDPAAFEPRALFTESGSILDYARDAGVAAGVLPMGGAFFYSAHARLAPRTTAHFLRTFPAAVRMARARLRADRPDVLHLNTSVLVAWGAAAQRERVPVLWTVREVLGPNPWLRRWQTGFIASHAARVVAISGGVAACFPRGQGVTVVENAVDPAEFAPALRVERAAVRAELGIPHHAPVVMAVGAVQRAKGHWLLLESFRRLLPDFPEARLVVVAGGVNAAYAASARGRVKRVLGLPLDNLDALRREAARAGVGDRLVATGFRQDVGRLVAAADVLAFPSLAPEGFGRPLIEAMAVGCPVVATDIGPSRDLVGDAGLLAPPDADAFAAALRRVLGGPALAARLAAAGPPRVAARFTLDRQVAAMTALYRDVAGARA